MNMSVAMAPHAKIKVRGSPGCDLLRQESVDPRAAEGLQREAASESSSPQQLDALLEAEMRHTITDPYQKLLFEVKALHKRGNFKSSQGEIIVQRVRDVASGGETTLDLSSFTIFDNFAELLAPYLRSKTCKLVALRLDKTPLGIPAAVAVAQAVNATLQTLQFSQQPILVGRMRDDVASDGKVVLASQSYNHLDAAAIGILVERERTKIQQLDLSGNCLTGPKMNIFHGIDIIFQGLKCCHQLKELNLGAVNLRSDGLVALSNAIQDFLSLERLNLSRNKLAHNSTEEKRVYGVESFCNVLWQAKKLRELNLSGNHLDYLSSTYIAQMLTVNCTLEVLNLSQNPLADAGVVLLAEGLKKNSSLLSLQLSGCRFGCEGTREIASVLRKFNNTLRTFDVRDNPEVRSQGYRGLAKCVSVNHHITEVRVNPGSKHEKFAVKIRDLLAVNSLLRAVRTDTKRLAAFPTLSESQRTNFVEKLERLSESELKQLYDKRVVQDAAILSDEKAATGLSTLRHYASLEKHAPLKRMLWLFEAGSRHEHLEWRSIRAGINKSGGKLGLTDPGDNEDVDEDIWDYPLF